MPVASQTAQILPVGPLLTTLPCLTEALYFVAKEGGYAGQRRLWAMQEAGRLIIHPWNEIEIERANALMTVYRDASIVAAAESLGVDQVFLLDRHFLAYRINGKKPFQVFP